MQKSKLLHALDELTPPYDVKCLADRWERLPLETEKHSKKSKLTGEKASFLSSGKVFRIQDIVNKLHAFSPGSCRCRSLQACLVYLDYFTCINYAWCSWKHCKLRRDLKLLLICSSSCQMKWMNRWSTKWNFEGKVYGTVCVCLDEHAWLLIQI